jgi:hypothetical protein
LITQGGDRTLSVAIRSGAAGNFDSVDESGPATHGNGDGVMISRFSAVLALATVAGLGYMGAARLGRWLDDPEGDDPGRTNPSTTYLADDNRTGWRRWTAQELTES